MDELAELRTQLAALRQRIDELEGAGTTSTAAAKAGAVDARAGTSTPSATPASRRGALRAAALAAGGVVAGSIATAQPAAAADGSAFILGSSGNTCTSLTGVNNTSAGSSGARFLFQSGTTYAPLSSAENAALAGWASDNGTARVGVYGFAGTAGGTAVVATATPLSGEGIAVRLRARTTHLRFNESWNGTPDPLTDTAWHQSGDITFKAGSLWVCIAEGTPGTWRRLSGAGTAGAFHPVTPFRAYDSRAAQPMRGKIGGTSDRVVSVANARNPDGSVKTANAVPAGATAVTGNFTIVGTSGSGYLSVNPGNAAALAASTINYTTSGATIANGFVCSLDSARQLKIFHVGGLTDFIVDITGYYR